VLNRWVFFGGEKTIDGRPLQCRSSATPPNYGASAGRLLARFICLHEPGADRHVKALWGNLLKIANLGHAWF